MDKSDQHVFWLNGLAGTENQPLPKHLQKQALQMEN